MYDVCVYTIHMHEQKVLLSSPLLLMRNSIIAPWSCDKTQTQPHTHTHVDTQTHTHSLSGCACVLVSGSVDELIYVLVCQLTCNLCINFEICFASRSHYTYATWCPTNTHVAKFCAHGRALSNCRRSWKGGGREAGERGATSSWHSPADCFDKFSCSCSATKKLCLGIFINILSSCLTIRSARSSNSNSRCTRPASMQFQGQQQQRWTNNKHVQLF